MAVMLLVSDLMKDSFRSSKDEDVKQFVNFIQTQEPSEICSLKSSKKDILIPSGKSVKVSCRANTGGLDKRTPVIFEPDEAAPWPDGLSIPETVVCVNPKQAGGGRNPPTGWFFPLLCRNGKQ